MRVRITFKVNNRGGLVPFHHQYLISEVFRDILQRESREELKNYPFFSFSGIKGQTRLSKAGLHYNSRRVTIVVSSPSADFIEQLVEAVFKNNEIQLGALNLTPEMAEEELSVTLNRETKFICISPIVTNDDFQDPNHKGFIEPSDNDFSDQLYDSTISRMTEFGIDTDAISEVHKFQLVPDEDYLNKLRASNKKFSRIYPVYHQGEQMEARGYTFPFTLFAAPEIQDFIFTCGLGTCCSMGFGMLDLVNSDPTERTVPYKSADSLIST
ncbi:MAG: CRISPR-associated endoribonuclease Cas6 [Marinoscillum sp.]|uniref:CRISPR-associated endoribonuclease Cas6 n=1 Tax=Marinoscillum sp. TaxID=2024838 RepID=UPI003300DD8D